jgi:ADP-ribosylglycohydrolase
MQLDIEELYPPEEPSGGQGTLSPEVVERAQGCLLGQLAGDALGSLVEFEPETSIRRRFPAGVRDFQDGGTHNTIAGQPTDDSEMALMLARSMVRRKRYDPSEAAVAYALWLDSGPFDCGNTTSRALRPALSQLASGAPAESVAAAARKGADTQSQANGALMRVSPLGIFAHAQTPQAAAQMAREDASLTHPHLVCQEANAVFVVALAHAIGKSSGPEETYHSALEWASRSPASAGGDEVLARGAVRDCLLRAASEPPPDFQHQQGWVLIALTNAFFQLLHATDVESGVCDTVMRGGDTDTNAAIAGALLGAVYGVAGIPERWRRTLLQCEPERGRPGVFHPRPKPFWPVDAMFLAQRVAELGPVTSAKR